MRSSGYILIILLFNLFTFAKAETGYDLWLRYQLIEDEQVLQDYKSQLKSLSIVGKSATIDAIREELTNGLYGLLGAGLPEGKSESVSLLVAKVSDLPASITISDKDLTNEGFLLKKIKNRIIITAKTDVGLLYGTFRFLRHLQTNQSLAKIDIVENPKVDIRILNHWDNLDRTSERGYAGFSLWDWHRLPKYIDPRYEDYARANASIGINGTVLTNVNANALVLTPRYIEKVKTLAKVFRPYGIKVYLTARFSAPIEIGGLETADPLDPEVKEWWKNKAKEIYDSIPDFGGFLVKANSEGQPGPQNYDRSHAEGANMLADAVKPFGGVVMWRAFVYSNEEPEDRAKQAYNEFKPLDGTFRDNVLIQVKNGPIDFQPREPFHPMFGAMPETPLMMEFQITQEYLGQATQLVYLAPMWKEVLNSDTYAKGKGSTVAKVVDGSLHDYPVSGIAGVANTGTDLNWTGHLMAQSNWYAFGRLTWDPELTSEGIADEWARMTFTNESAPLKTIKEIMMNSWEAAVSYMTPLGLHHLMGTGHHYGPAPWVDNLSRADWTPVYYHRADSIGIGFDRTEIGSDAVGQYFPEVEKKFGNIENCPEKFLLWFHHVAWDYEMGSGRTLWNELGFKYQEGVNEVREMQSQWSSLENTIDEERFNHVSMLLEIQKDEAIWWKDASLLYFQTFSDRPFPESIEQPKKTLKYYQSLFFPYAPGIRPRW